MGWELWIDGVREILLYFYSDPIYSFYDEKFNYSRVVYNRYSVSSFSYYLLFNLLFQSNNLTYLQKYSSRQFALLKHVVLLLSTLFPVEENLTQNIFSIVIK